MLRTLTGALHRLARGRRAAAALLAGSLVAPGACTEAEYQPRGGAAAKQLVGSYALRSVRFASGPWLLGLDAHFSFRELMFAEVRAGEQGLTMTLTTCAWTGTAIGLGSFGELPPRRVPERVLDVQIEGCERDGDGCGFSARPREAYTIGYSLMEAPLCAGHAGEEIARPRLPWSSAAERCVCAQDPTQPPRGDALDDCRIDDVDKDDQPGFSAPVGQTGAVYYFAYTGESEFASGVIAADGHHRARDRRRETFHFLGCSPAATCTPPDNRPCPSGTSQVDFVPLPASSDPCKTIRAQEADLFDNEPRFPDQGC